MPKLEVSRVQRATTAERPRCLAALVAAFVDDPLLRWMLPDPATYLEFFPQVVTFYGGRAFEHDSAFRTDDFRAAALWLPHAGAIAYLEASNERNVPLYQRFGFEVLGEIQQGSSPLVIPMLRPARPRP